MSLFRGVNHHRANPQMSADYMVCAGDESQDMYILTSGSAQELNKNRVLRVLHAGDSFGEMLCFGFRFRCQVLYPHQPTNTAAARRSCLSLAAHTTARPHDRTSERPHVRCSRAYVHVDVGPMLRGM